MGDRIACPRFVGGSNRLIAPTVSVEASINLFVESSPETGKVPAYLRPTEGLDPFAQVADVDTTKCFYQDGRLFGVTGTTFWEGYDDGTTVVWGSVPYDGLPATIVSNGSAGHQVAICQGGEVAIFDLITNAFTNDVLTGNVVNMIEFMDGYFIALLRNSRQFRMSDLEDGLTWPFGLIFERSWGSDNISFLKRTGRQLFIIGTQTGEVWADNGNANTPFAPIQGVFLDQGCVAPFSACRDGDTLIWLNQDEQGGGVVVKAKGYQAQDISTYSVNVKLSELAGVLNGAVGLVHQMQGHVFYWIQIDQLDRLAVRQVLKPTPVLDLKEGIWCERGMWDPVNGEYLAHIARCHVWAFERHLIGDKTSGVIYEINPLFTTDGIVP